MIEQDYNKWLDAKGKIENFDRISELNKKEIYKVEQKLTGFEAVDLIEVQYYHNSDRNESRLEYYFEWTGHHFRNNGEDFSERPSHEMMIEKLENRISLSGKDRIYLGFVFIGI